MISRKQSRKLPAGLMIGRIGAAILQSDIDRTGAGVALEEAEAAKADGGRKIARADEARPEIARGETRAPSTIGELKDGMPPGIHLEVSQFSDPPRQLGAVGAKEREDLRRRNRRRIPRPWCTGLLAFA